MGDINLYPRRVVIDGRQRIASVGIYNKTANEGDYEITISNMVMSPTGQIFAVDSLPAGVTAEGLQAADGMLRWSPRRVTLLGNEAQTVRIMARPPADLPPGEYRSHFSVVSIPRDVEGGFSIDEAVNGEEGSETGIGVLIRPRFGISIPVIVRIGETTLDVSLSKIAMFGTEQGPMIGVTIERSGTRSAYGDLVVTMPGQSEPVAIARGIGVYPEVDSRPYVLALNPEFDPALLASGTRLKIEYLDDDVSPGSTLASQEFTVP
ncbi:hypothetical protein ACI5KX_00630 [Erythrobacter sp. GH1-10]|uniref:hypothetical protein n=1 Tax=Erythrobacter sp. GH1-10 TaxID=3349334 RepID=UPI003877D9F7